ncbi:hypothetical protein HELRODRAFT_164422 [Helobdella robusta]|uniref:Uncharacterized protein n=1 Tax=Helobdella robusta TaxID=6412 RepID=T1EVE4_HELRO|nr:hypothetical protein HELRODRAFT_164422 [Helobdella robusta]ESN94561.1 hypothetical protein HELRODRAFT_164422 [Helobdella robusta]
MPARIAVPLSEDSPTYKRMKLCMHENIRDDIIDDIRDDITDDINGNITDDINNDVTDDINDDVTDDAPDCTKCKSRQTHVQNTQHAQLHTYRIRVSVIRRTINGWIGNRYSQISDVVSMRMFAIPRYLPASRSIWMSSIGLVFAQHPQRTERAGVDCHGLRLKRVLRKTAIHKF